MCPAFFFLFSFSRRCCCCWFFSKHEICGFRHVFSMNENLSTMCVRSPQSLLLCTEKSIEFASNALCVQQACTMNAVGFVCGDIRLFYHQKLLVLRFVISLFVSTFGQNARAQGFTQLFFLMCFSSRSLPFSFLFRKIFGIFDAK